MVAFATFHTFIKMIQNQDPLGWFLFQIKDFKMSEFEFFRTFVWVESCQIMVGRHWQFFILKTVIFLLNILIT